jgi:hypothetical protein
MLPGPRLGLFVEPVDERLELLAVHPPDATAPDLDRGELARPDESVDLRNAHAQIGRDIVERQEARLDLGPFRPLVPSGIPARHAPTIAAVDDGYMDLASFALVWTRDDPLRGTSRRW